MCLVADVSMSKRVPLNGESDEERRLDKVKQIRSQVPAVTHVDYSARLQTVDAQRHGKFFKLLEEFARQTGCPLLINTSFNIRGEPIVATPEDAFRCFMATEMDVLVLEDFVLLKSEQQEFTGDRKAAYFAEHILD